MKLFASLLLAASLAAPVFSAHAEAPKAAAKADPAKGAASYAPVCAACHGPDGNSMVPANPKLAQ
jgi:cytochrome c553